MYLTLSQTENLNNLFDELTTEIVANSSLKETKEVLTKLSKKLNVFTDEDFLAAEKYLTDLAQGKKTTTNNNPPSDFGPQSRNKKAAITPGTVFNKILGTTSLKIEEHKRVATALFNLLLLIKKPTVSPYLKNYDFILTTETNPTKIEDNKNKLHELSQMFLNKIKYFELTDDTEFLNDTIKNLNQKLKKQEDEYKKLSQEIKKVAQKNQIKESQITTTQSVSLEPDVHAEEILKQKNLIKASEEEIAKLKNIIKERDISISTNKLLLDTREKRLGTLEQENLKLAKEVTQKDQEITALKNQLKQAEEHQHTVARNLANESVNVHEQIAAKDNEIRLLSTKVQQLQTSNAFVQTITLSTSSKFVYGLANKLIADIVTQYNISIDSPILKALRKQKYTQVMDLSDVVSKRKIDAPLPTNEQLEFLKKLVWFVRKQNKNNNVEVTTDDGYTLLNIATYFGNYEVVSSLLARGADPRNKNVTDGLDSLAIAVVHGHEHLIQQLLDYTIKKHAKSVSFLTKPKQYNKEFSLVDLAVRFGRNTILKEILGKVTLTDTQYSHYISSAITEHNDNELLTILLNHAQENQVTLRLNEFIYIVDNIEMLKTLLFYGAYLSPSTLPSFIKDTEVLTSNLHFAVAVNDLNLCQKSLKDPLINSEQNLTESFLLALAKGLLEIAALLSDEISANNYTIDFDCLCQIILRDETYLKKFFNTFINKALWSNFKKEQMHQLISKIETMQVSADTINVLQQDTRFGRYLAQSLVETLKKMVANKEVKEEQILPKITSDLEPLLAPTFYDDEPLIVLAILNDRVKVVKQLLEIKMNPDLLLNDFQTPLHIAIKERKYDIACLLLQHGANITQPSMTGGVPLASAVKQQDNLAISMLTNQKYSSITDIISTLRSCLESYIKNNDTASLDLLINCCDKHLLQQACSVDIMTLVIARERYEILTRLWEFDLNWAAKNKYGITLLDLAYYTDNKLILTLLHKKYVKSDLHVTNSSNQYIPSQDEQTYLTALEKGQQDIVLRFIKQRTFVPDFIFRTRNMTPLMIASLKGYTPIVQILLDAGASKTLKNAQNLDATLFAAMSDFIETATLLNKNDASDPLDAYLNLSTYNYNDFFVTTLGNSLTSPLLSPKRKVSELEKDEDLEEQQSKHQKRFGNQ